MMMPFALLIYINEIQNRRYNALHTTLFCIALINFIVWTIIHFTGIKSFQLSAIYIDAVLAVIILCVTSTLLLDVHKKHIKDYMYTATGFLIFMLMCIVEIITIVFTQKDFNLVSMISGLISFLVMVVIQQIFDWAESKTDLEQAVYNKTIENEQMLIHIVQTLAETIDAKDTYTKGHSGRVAAYSKEIARRYGYNESDQNDIYMIGLLHDIGKIGIPDAVINKPGKLNDAEYEIIKNHPVIGSNILKNIKEKESLYVGARWHHERYDGNGYPDGIKGENIPEQARIIAVADAYDAMTSYRSYREPLPQEQVIAELENGLGSQFDPCFASIMIQIILEDKEYDLREKR